MKKQVYEEKKGAR